MEARNQSGIGAVLLFLLLLLLSSSVYSNDVLAGGRRRALAVSPPSSALPITFVDAAAGLLDTGTIVWRGGAGRAAITTRTVRMRVGAPADDSRGTVTIRAFLETADPRCTIRIDGVPLGAAARVIRRNAPVGIVFAHRIEIEVPVTAADGPLQFSIGWEVTTE